MEPRDMLLGKMQSRLDVDQEPARNRSGEPKAIRKRVVHFSARQEQLVRLASQSRGLPMSHSKNRNYLEMATLAFTAYDLDLNFFELLTGKEFPAERHLAEVVEKVARNERGQWGILGLGDHQRGRP